MSCLDEWDLEVGKERLLPGLQCHADCTLDTDSTCEAVILAPILGIELGVSHVLYPHSSSSWDRSCGPVLPASLVCTVLTCTSFTLRSPHKHIAEWLRMLPAVCERSQGWLLWQQMARGLLVFM